MDARLRQGALFSTGCAMQLAVWCAFWSTLMLLALSGCNAPDKSNLEATAHASNLEKGNSDMQITTSAFTAGGSIPRRFTCEGEDISPELNWTNVPGRARTLALLVEDPDAPDPKAPKLTWTHWALYDIPKNSTGLSEAVSQLPEGTRQGLNDWKQTGYRGPCPPIGRHRYFFKLYAIEKHLGDLSNPTRAQLLDALSGHIVGTAELMGTYQKQ